MVDVFEAGPHAKMTSETYRAAAASTIGDEQLIDTARPWGRESVALPLLSGPLGAGRRLCCSSRDQ